MQQWTVKFPESLLLHLMEERQDNRALRVLVVGAGRIGAPIAGELARRGCAVTVFDVNERAASSTKRRVEDARIFLQFLLCVNFALSHCWSMQSKEGSLISRGFMKYSDELQWHGLQYFEN